MVVGATPPGHQRHGFLPSLFSAIAVLAAAKSGPKMAAAVPDITSKFILSHWLGLYHMTILEPMTGGFP